MLCSHKPIIPDLWFVWISFHRVAPCITCDYDDDELVTLRDCQEKESDQLQEQHSLLEQEAASSRDRDDELTAKNRKLHKKIDNYKRELKQAKDDVSTLKSQLQQTRQDEVVIHRTAVYFCRCQHVNCIPTGHSRSTWMEYRHCHKMMAHNGTFLYGTDNGRGMLSTRCDGRILLITRDGRRTTSVINKLRLSHSAHNMGRTTDDECYSTGYDGRTLLITRDGQPTDGRRQSMHIWLLRRVNSKLKDSCGERYNVWVWLAKELLVPMVNPAITVTV